MGSVQAQVQSQVIMLLYLCLGVLCRKLGYLNSDVETKLSGAITNIVLPCMIFDAMHKTMEDMVLLDALLVGIISMTLILLYYAMGKLIYRNVPSGQKAVYVFSMMSCNTTFVGLPVIASVYGEQGIFYAAIYMTISRIFIWTLGLELFVRKERGSTLRRIITNPNNIAVVLAVIIYCLRISLPAAITSAVEEIGNTSTLLCMVMLGSLIANSIKKRNFMAWNVWGYSAIRLLLIPLGTFALLRPFALSPVLSGSMVLMVAAPAPVMVCVMAKRYEKDVNLAALLVLVSTVLSFATQPLLTYVCRL